MALQDRIRFAREYVGFSQEQATEKLRIPLALLAAFENGTAEVAPHALEQMANLYRRPVPWFYGEFKVKVSPALARRLENPRLTEGDREAVLDFVEFLQGAGSPEQPSRRAAEPKDA